jgi:putative tryptophan/tyrosine transport system substrate-binding protein
MKKNILAVALCSMLLALCASASAQQPKKVPSIGLLSSTGAPKTPGAQDEAFRRGLRDLGYVEGKNVVVEYRYLAAEPNRAPAFVEELVRLKVDVLVIGALPVIRAAKQATKTIPIVMVTVQDPVATGLIDSLARPGGNITGLTMLTRELSGKRLELFTEVMPTPLRVGILWDVKGESANIGFKDYETAARSLKIPLQPLGLRLSNADLNDTFQAAAKGRVNALVTIMTPPVLHYQKQIVDFAIKNRLPSMWERSEFVEAGGLVSYAASDEDEWRRAAYFVDKILKGAKPADLPVEQPTKFEFIINLKTAKQIGLTIPPNVLARADRVIK